MNFNGLLRLQSALGKSVLNEKRKAQQQMKKSIPYFFEHLLIVIVILLGITGFWNLYFGVDSDPNLYHHLHVTTNFIWLFLLLFQLSLIKNNNYRDHRKIGLAILIMGPLLVASTALLSVHSAHKGLVSGQGDFLIVQNVMGTLELGFIILSAFILRKQRKLHGSFLLSTAILFMGIAIFFTLISFVPSFKIEGPETFYRFETAAATGRYICMFVGFLFFIKDFKNGWPLFAVSLFFTVNELIKSFLAKHNLIQPLTEFVGSMSQSFTFIGTFAVFFALLAATGVLGAKQNNGSTA